MKKIILSVFLVFSLIACKNSESKKDKANQDTIVDNTNEKEAVQSEEGWKDLLNGENLDGWKIHGTEKWYVEDGLLISESGPDKEYGYLATNDNYKNFEVHLEFKQEADGNSGVFIRSEIDGTRIAGWQVEVAPPDLHTGGIYESYGRGWLIKPSEENEKVLKFGDWNELEIKVEGDRVTSWLNGVEMVDLTDEKIGEANGKIALQIHDGGGIKVYWKNIRIKEL